MTAALAKTETEPETKIYARIPRDRVHPDPDQPRKTFDAAKLAELADSITLHDVIVPIEVRPHPKKDGHFIITAGERRWRAAGQAGKADVPCVVEQRPLTGTEVLERQILENSQREDVPPLEEAEAYQDLLKNHGYTMDLLITKTGKSKAHLYGRMKLLKLNHFPREALYAGKLSVAIAELIARVDPALQQQCAREAMGLDVTGLADHGIEHERVGDDEDLGRYVGDPKPLSFDAVRALIRRKYSTKLSLAKFDPRDATLTKAGSCESCEFRSGNQPELPGIAPVAGAGDLCTKVSCFEDKTHAAWKRAEEDAEKRGLEVVDGKRASECFEWDGIKVSGHGPFVDLSTEVPSHLLKQPGKSDTFGKLLGKAAADIPRALVKDEAGAPRELISREAAIAKLAELGKVDKPTKPSSSSSVKPKAPTKAEREAEAKRREKEHEKEELLQSTLSKVLGQVAELALDVPEKKEVALWKWMARCLIDGQTFELEDEGTMLHRRGLGKVDELLDLVEKSKTVEAVRSIVVEWLLTGVGTAKTAPWASKETKARFDEACRLFSVDWDKTFTSVKDAKKAEAKKPATDDGKRCGVVNGKKGDGCIHDQGHEGAHSDGKRTWPNKPAKK